MFCGDGCYLVDDMIRYWMVLDWYLLVEEEDWIIRFLISVPSSSKPCGPELKVHQIGLYIQSLIFLTDPIFTSDAITPLLSFN